MPFATNCSRSAFVAATTRTSGRIDSWPPTRRNSTWSRTRSSLAWKPGSASPISSRNSVPWLACSKHPARRPRRSREGAPFVPEQFALGEGLHNCHTIQGYERPGSSRRTMYFPGHQLLAGAAFPTYQLPLRKCRATAATVFSASTIFCERPTTISPPTSETGSSGPASNGGGFRSLRSR